MVSAKSTDSTVPAVRPGGERLQIFISSKMAELRDVRDIINHALESRGIEAWVYELDAGARPDPVTEMFLDEVELSDVFVALFSEKLGEITAKEFQHARSVGKPCFVYVRDKDKKRDRALDEWLKSQIFEPNTGVTYDFFDSAVELSTQIAEDVMAWLVRRHREMTAQIESARISQDEIAKLKSEVERLQSMSRESLPIGTPVDYLAQQMERLV